MILSRTELVPGNLMREESLFSTANGYIGVRGCFEEGCPSGVPTIRGCYANGFYDNVKLNYPEKLYGFPEEAQRMVNLPDVQNLKLYVNGEEFSMFEGRLEKYEHESDTRNGTVSRRVNWISPKGSPVNIDITRMASFTHPNLFLTVYEVTLPGGGGVTAVSKLDCRNVSNYSDANDPRVASEKQRCIFPDYARVFENGGLVQCRTGASGFKVALCQIFNAGPDAKISVKTIDDGIEAVITRNFEAGGKLRIEKYTTVSDSRRESHPDEYARKIAEECRELGAEFLLGEQEAFLKDFLQSSEVEIYGDDSINEAMEYNLYMLLSSAGRDAVSSVCAKGLSGEGYEGHYFWDTEIYIIPFFALTQPRIARRLLEYRFNMLDAAKRHARVMGHEKGALYPWRTISGSECSSYFPSGSAQYHINGDIAHSVTQYRRLTGDTEFMTEMGNEILLETARLWLDAGNYEDRGERPGGNPPRFCINSVTGPDEYSCIVNNNYYTNMTAKQNLLAAAEICETGEAEEFRKAANAMYLPFDGKLGIHAQDDAFLNKPVWDLADTPAENFPLLLHYHPLMLYRHQVCKQADTILAHFLFEEDTDEDVLRKSFDYYEKITTHDSSLSPCVFSIMAARLGMIDKAYDYFLKTVRTDLDDIHGNTKDGIHTANMGGAYMCLTAGFAGLRVKDDGLHFRFTLPSRWTGYKFSVWYRGSKLKVTADKNGGKVALESGPPVEVTIEGKKIRITAE